MTINKLIERTEERRINTYLKRNQHHKKRNDLKHTGAMALTQFGFSSISPYDKEDLTVEGLNIHQVVSRNFCQMACMGTSYFSSDLSDDELLDLIDIEEIDDKYIPKNLALSITRGLQKSTTSLSVNDLFEESLKLAVCGGFALLTNKPLLTPFTANAGHGYISEKDVNILLIGIEESLKDELLDEANKTKANMLEDNSAEKINLIQVGLGSLPMVANYIEQELPIATGAIDLVVIGNDGFAGIPIIAESYGTKVVSTKYQMDGAEFTSDAKEIIEKGIESFKTKDPNYMYIDDAKFEVMVGSSSQEKMVYLDAYDLELVEFFENNGYAVATIGCNVDKADSCIHFPDLASMIADIRDRKTQNENILIFTKATPQTITISMFMRMIGVSTGFMDYPPIYGSDELVDLFFTHPAFSGKLLIHSNPQTMLELMKKENL